LVCASYASRSSTTNDRVSRSVISRDRVPVLPAPAELFQLALLFFDLFLLALEMEQLLLCFLHLRIEMLGAGTIVFIQFQHLFNRARRSGIRC
jgi:hypothetical protein